MRESQHSEWKESWRDEYLRWICGFANAEGGMLVIGRNDKGKIVGVPTAEVTPQVTPEVTPEVARLLEVLTGEMGRAELMAALGLRDEKHFREQYQQAAVAAGMVEMTVPDKPKSRLQKYRLTPAGRAYLERLRSQGKTS